LFLSRYVPLAEAHHAGVLEGFPSKVRTEWAESFARSYIEAFAALPIAALDSLTLQDKLRDIGRMAGATAKENA